MHLFSLQSCDRRGFHRHSDDDGLYGTARHLSLTPISLGAPSSICGISNSSETVNIHIDFILMSSMVVNDGHIEEIANFKLELME